MMRMVMEIPLWSKDFGDVPEGIESSDLFGGNAA